MLRLKFFIDECLSPQLAQRLRDEGIDAVHPRDRGKLEIQDHSVLKYCLDEDRIIVTHNADDFRGLVGKSDMHVGLIILAENSLENSWLQLDTAMNHINHEANQAGSDARDYMFNRVIEVNSSLEIRDYLLPEA